MYIYMRVYVYIYMCVFYNSLKNHMRYYMAILGVSDHLLKLLERWACCRIRDLGRLAVI